MQASLERLRERRREGDEGGFTLIELLIVIVILAILAAIVVFAVDAVTGSSARASCESDVQTVDHAVQAYLGQVAKAPTSITQLETATTGSDGTSVGPWLHNTPNNGKHYSVIVADGVVAYGGWETTANTAGVPPAGTVIVETENAAGTGFTAAPAGQMYVSPTTPAGVTGGTIAAVVYPAPANTPSAACANIS